MKKIKSCFVLSMAFMALVGFNSKLATPVLDVKYDEVERLSIVSAQQINVGDGQPEVIKALGISNIIDLYSFGKTTGLERWPSG